MSPFAIDFIIGSLNETVSVNGTVLHAMDAKTTPCGGSCTCNDCKESCPPNVPCPEAQEWLIFDIDGIYFCLACICGGFLFIFFLALVSFSYTNSK